MTEQSAVENFKEFDNKKQSNLTLIFKDGSELYVQKEILTEKSEIFAQMLENNETTEIKISGSVSKETFELILKYLNTNQRNFSMKNADLLFNAAAKYGFKSLKSKCEEFLLSKLNSKTVLQNQLLMKRVPKILFLADEHNSEKLKQKCIDVINQDIPNMIQTSGWKVIKEKRPKLLEEVLKDLAMKYNQLKRKVN